MHKLKIGNILSSLIGHKDETVKSMSISLSGIIQQNDQVTQDLTKLENQDTIDELLDSLESDNDDLKHKALSLIWDLCIEKDENRVELREKGILDLIVPCLKSEFLETLEVACGAISVLALNGVNSEILGAKGAIQFIVPMLTVKNAPKLVEYAIYALGNLAYRNPQNQEEMVNDKLFATIAYLLSKFFFN
jgi:hypothetical protein